MKIFVAILLIAAVPPDAQAQNLTKDDAQKVVTIISCDKAKMQTYCDIKKIAEQMDRDYEKNDDKWAMNCRRKLTQRKKPSVQNMLH